MDSIEDFKKALTPKMSIDAMIRKIFTDKEVKDQAIEFNQDQLMDGLDTRDTKIFTTFGDPYAEKTKEAKRKKGQPSDKVTLYDTGDFYKTFKVVSVPGGWEILADWDIHDSDIRDNFTTGFDFLGLDQESLTELVDDWVYPLLAQMIKKELNV